VERGETNLGGSLIIAKRKTNSNEEIALSNERRLNPNRVCTEMGLGQLRLGSKPLVGAGTYSCRDKPLLEVENNLICDEFNLNKIQTNFG